MTETNEVARLRAALEQIANRARAIWSGHPNLEAFRWIADTATAALSPAPAAPPATAEKCDRNCNEFQYAECPGTDGPCVMQPAPAAPLDTDSDSVQRSVNQVREAAARAGMTPQQLVDAMNRYEPPKAKAAPLDEAAKPDARAALLARKIVTHLQGRGAGSRPMWQPLVNWIAALLDAALAEARADQQRRDAEVIGIVLKGADELDRDHWRSGFIAGCRASRAAIERGGAE